jgi:Zn-dependent peptidase ImmA (M78 family)/transcriptional regulator with XRE-family HTH domain
MPTISRLKSARVLRGLSLKALAERTGQEISLAMLSRYERGEIEPDAKKLRVIARALDLSLDYFTRKPKEVGAVAFRKKKRLGKKIKDQILEQTRDFLERSAQIEHSLGVKFSRIPTYEQQITSLEQIDEAAKALRKKWKLGRNPIHSIVDELEAENIRVLAIEADEAFDGMASLPTNEEHFIVFNSARSIDRQRFTLLHEIGHHYLDIAPTLDEEKVVNRFAGAFAVPKQEMIDRVGAHRRRFHPVELLEMKSEFGLSVAALLYRAKDIGILSDHAFRDAMISISSLGWRKQEPDVFNGNETPSRLLELLGKGIAEELITQSRAAELYGMKLGDFRDVLLKGM